MLLCFEGASVRFVCGQPPRRRATGAVAARGTGCAIGADRGGGRGVLPPALRRPERLGGRSAGSGVGMGDGGGAHRGGLYARVPGEAVASVGGPWDGTRKLDWHGLPGSCVLGVRIVVGPGQTVAPKFEELAVGGNPEPCRGLGLPPPAPSLSHGHSEGGGVALVDSGHPVAQFVAFGLQIPLAGIRGLGDQRDVLDDLQPITGQTGHFCGVVGHQAQPPQA